MLSVFDRIVKAQRSEHSIRLSPLDLKWCSNNDINCSCKPLSENNKCIFRPFTLCYLCPRGRNPAFSSFNIKDKKCGVPSTRKICRDVLCKKPTLLVFFLLWKMISSPSATKLRAMPTTSRRKPNDTSEMVRLRKEVIALFDALT